MAANSDNGVIDGWRGRRLPGLLAAAGLADVRIRAFTPLERDPAGFYAATAERAAGRFLGGRTHVFVWGTRAAAG